MPIPEFIARQFYVSNSLRNTPTGFRLQAKNPLGDGTLVGVRDLRVDGHPVPPDAVSAVDPRSGRRLRGSEISPANPVRVHKGDAVTLEVQGPQLGPGKHTLEVTISEVSAGTLALRISDRLNEG